MYATCETGGCASAWVPVKVTGDYVVFCGACGNQITNITDIEAEEGTVLPEWILEMLEQQNSNDSNG